MESTGRKLWGGKVDIFQSGRIKLEPGGEKLLGEIYVLSLRKGTAREQFATGANHTRDGRGRCSLNTLPIQSGWFTEAQQ